MGSAPSRRLWLTAPLYLLPLSCGPRVRAQFTNRAPLGPAASIPLPDGFAPIEPLPVSPPLDPDDLNLWVRLHAWSFTAAPQVLLAVAQLADLPSQLSPAKLLDALREAFPKSPWPALPPAAWQKTPTGFAARTAQPAPEINAHLVVDRDRLLQVLLIGPSSWLDATLAQAIAQAIPAGYQTAVAPAQLFQPVLSALDQHTARRRTHYRDLLAALDREELDYVPTPNLVVFNPRLAALFRAARFDRSGIPARFAIVGLLGALNDSATLPLDELREAFSLVQFRTAQLQSGEVQFSSGPELSLAREVVARAGWLMGYAPGATLAIGALEIHFAQAPVDFSVWLTQLERLGRWLDAEGHIAARP